MITNLSYIQPGFAVNLSFDAVGFWSSLGYLIPIPYFLYHKEGVPFYMMLPKNWMII